MDLGLTDVKEGCDIGNARVAQFFSMVNPVLSCLTLVGEAQRKSATVIKGSVRGNKFVPVQKAFTGKGVTQYGVCIPRMILLEKALLESNLKPSVDEIGETTLAISADLPDR